MLKVGIWIFAIGIGLRLLGFIITSLSGGTKKESGKPSAEAETNAGDKTKPPEPLPLAASAPKPEAQSELPKAPVVAVKPAEPSPPPAKPQVSASDSKPQWSSDCIQLRCSGCSGKWELSAQASAKLRNSDVTILPPCPNCGGDRYPINK